MSIELSDISRRNKTTDSPFANLVKPFRSVATGLGGFVTSSFKLHGAGRDSRCGNRAEITDAQRATSELAVLRQAIEDHTLYSIADSRGRIIDVNEGFCRISGYSREELLGKDHRVLNSGHHPREFWIEMWRTITSGKPWRAEVCNRAKDGSLYWVDSTNIPEIGSDGKIQRFVSLRFDITKQKDAEIEISKTKARLERAYDATSDGIWEYCIATKNFWYSDQFLSLLGKKSEEISTSEEAFYEWVHPADRASLFEEVNAAISAREAFDTEFRLIVDGSGYRWFRSRGKTICDESGSPIQVSGAITDIHNRRSAETRLHLATRAASIGLWDINTTTGDAYFSDTFYTMLGYEPGELPMCFQTWLDLVHPEDVEAALSGMEKHRFGEIELFVSEHRLRMKTGEWLYVRCVGELVEPCGDEAPTRILGVHINIQQLRSTIDLANRANQTKSEFLANMSHEIRTPMTAILGYTDLLIGDLTDDPDSAKDAIRTIQSNANHLLTVINDILDVSKIEAGQLEVEKIDTSPIQIVEEVISLIGARARGKGIDIRLQLESPIPATIQSDPTRLRQILLNLTGNAVKFTEIGSVTISVSCSKSEEEMTFRVIDTGIGMTKEQCDKISKFDPFSQADTSTTRKYGGSGLGLRISHALSKMLGGDLAIESESGEGSVFSVTIDTGDLSNAAMIDGLRDVSCQATRPEEPSRISKKRSSSPSLSGIRVLLAEDGPDNQRLISFHLRKAGADVTVCENGLLAAEAIENASPENCPHVVFMDMQMPVLDGYSATRRLRQNGHDVPIIALTAHAMEGDRQNCLSAGCTDYLTKPIDREKLIDYCSQYASTLCQLS